jgi:hypothetical protein
MELGGSFGRSIVGTIIVIFVCLLFKTTYQGIGFIDCERNWKNTLRPNIMVK